VEKIDEYKERYAKLFPELNERQRRLVAAADAIVLGYGGIEVIHKASNLARNTIQKGIRELEEGEHLPEGRCRKAGGGRKRASEKDEQLEEDLLLCIKPVTKGDPMSPLLWVSKSSRKIQGLLQKQGHRISHTSVRTLLQRNGYTLQSNRKSREEKAMREEERDQQFHSISHLAGSYLKAGSPVVSSDTKKKELVGNYKNAGRTWQVSKKPIEVKMHDFPEKKLGKALPYGVYDLAMNEGYVTVGITHDTAEFAVASIANWWEHLGKEKYAAATKLLITVDAGGSNGYRVRLWKLKLQEFADRSHLAITVCHFPAGASKWNAIEHKLFSFISMNWKGQPLLSLQVIISLIRATTTQTGLKVYASLDTQEYETKKEVTQEQMKSLHLFPHKFHPELNYTLLPRS
jgi:transposase